MIVLKNSVATDCTVRMGPCLAVNLESLGKRISMKNYLAQIWPVDTSVEGVLSALTDGKDSS